MLAAGAYDHSLVLGEQISLALREALFEEGGDIADPPVLHSIADRAGLELSSRGGRDKVLADWREGQRRGVIGSPHFLVRDQGFFCPSLDISRIDGQLRITSDRGALDAFLELALGRNLFTTPAAGSASS